MKRLLLTAALMVIAVGCSQTPSERGGSSTVAAAPNTPTTVATVPVVSKKLETTISLPAQLTPYEQVDIYPKVTGFVQTVTVDRGSRVHRGQLLVRLTAPELVSERYQAEAAVGAAQSQLATAQAKLASDNGTYLHMVAASKTPGVLAENDVVVAGQAVSADKGVVEAADQNIAAARDALRSVSQTESYLTITAPFEGVVTTRNLHPGALIGPASGASGAQPILQIVDEKRLRLVVPIPEAQIGEMKVGQLVSFTVPADPGQTFNAPIKRISGKIDENSRTMPVELDVVNRNGRLSPGSFTTVSWPLERSHPTLFVPASAVTSDQQHTFVIRVRNNKAEWVTVQSGQSVDGQIEVFGDLVPGDEVVKIGSDSIHSGDSVRVQNSDSAFNR
ncbi:MAG TPA: efflux RND transporter periplasmic adaptor subunit [Acidobacteriaceae bacterium]|nr:efflux RND transporter periplasmic adaptor subunit [Acidobacteriaceae bacterium]